jgi:hypothetical protein
MAIDEKARSGHEPLKVGLVQQKDPAVLVLEQIAGLPVVEDLIDALRVDPISLANVSCGK